MKKGIICSILFAMAFIAGNVAFSVNAVAQNSLRVDAPSVVAVDEVFQIVFTADGKAKDFSLPAMQDITVLAGPTSSTFTNISVVNGKRTQQYEESFTYVAQCSKEGVFTIPSASVKIDGKTYTSSPVQIEVVKEAENAAEKEDGKSDGGQSSSLRSDDLLMVLEISDRNVVIGEPVIAEIKLYTNVNIAGFEDVRFPSFNGFWSQELDSPTQVSFNREKYNGRIYNAALLKKYVLIPQQSGKIKIDPAELVCAVQVQTASRGSSFFDDFFGSYQTLRKRLVTPEVYVNVASLPSGAPASFKGAVGKFSMETSLSKENLKEHEAASLTVTISGSGNLNLIESPDVKFPADFEMYDVKRSEKIRTTSGGATGKKIFEYPFIPRSSGEFRMEPVEFTYYDPSARKYVTLKSDQTVLNVEKGEGQSALVLSPGGVNKRSVKNLGEDIRFISNDLSSLKKNPSSLVDTWKFYAAIVFVCILFVLTVLVLDRKIERNRDVVKVRNRKASKVAKARLKGAGILLKQGLDTAFYEELHKALFCYISDKLMLPVSDISKERVEEKLLEMGKSPELISELFALVEACEFARYAPSGKPGAMEEQYKEALRIISRMED